MSDTSTITAAQCDKNKSNEVFWDKCGPLTNESVQNVNFHCNLVSFSLQPSISAVFFSIDDSELLHSK